MSEIWKIVPNYDPMYLVSDKGNVFSVKSQKLLSPRPTNGYCKVTLYKDGFPKCFSVHRLVAEAFIENEEGKPQVNHIDGNKCNNCVDNLEWATASENQLHAVRTGLHAQPPLKGKFGAENYTSRRICQYTLDGTFVREWPSISDASRFVGSPVTAIVSAARGRRKNCAGFVWRYPI